MIDPISAAQLAVELAAVCTKAVSLIKKAIEAMRKVRNELLELLNRTERMRNILELLRNLLREIRNTPHRDTAIGLNESACRQTMKDLEDLAKNIAGTRLTSSFLAGAQWFQYEGKAKDMVIKLRNQETDIINILVLIGVAASIKTEVQVLELKDKVIREAEVVDAFDGLTLVGESLQAPVSEPKKLEPLRTWLGHTLVDCHSDQYLAARSALSDAAYWGQWKEFWSMFQIGQEKYTESWVNAVRIKPLKKINEMSYWTPLHQAVYNHVDVGTTLELIEELLKAGAFSKSLPDIQWTNEFSYMDMTPLDLARELGHEPLYQILSPVIRQSVPSKVLEALQERFHELITRDIGDRITEEHIYLPVLEVLTELEVPQMWFPIKLHRYSPAGYVYLLDGRDLLVKSYQIQASDAFQTYRITQTEILDIDDALVFGS